MDEAAKGFSILADEAHRRVLADRVHLFQRHKHHAKHHAKNLDKEIALAKAQARREEDVDGGALVTALDSEDEEDRKGLQELDERMRAAAAANQSLLGKMAVRHAPSSTILISHNSRRLKVAATNAVRSSLAAQAQVAALAGRAANKPTWTDWVCA